MNIAPANSRVHHFKLVLLGDTAVGKSCLVVRFVRDEFFEFQEPTIGGMLELFIGIDVGARRWLQSQILNPSI